VCILSKKQRSIKGGTISYIAEVPPPHPIYSVGNHGADGVGVSVFFVNQKPRTRTRESIRLDVGITYTHIEEREIYVCVGLLLLVSFVG
jgi:hypothetical protein